MNDTDNPQTSHEAINKIITQAAAVIETKRDPPENIADIPG